MRRPFLLRLVEDYWGILLLLLAWQAWVAINSFNPIVMPTPVAVIGDLVGHPGVYLRNVGITLSVALFGLAMGIAVGWHRGSVGHPRFNRCHSYPERRRIWPTGERRDRSRAYLGPATSRCANPHGRRM